MNTTAALRIPEAMGQAEIGPYIRELREHFKLSPQEVSERIHIRVRYVTAIEEGKFDQMPGKVYARGYLHTYAEFLGLDADQVVAQCFAAGNAATPIATPVAFAPTVKLSSAPSVKTGGGAWRGIGIVIVVALLSLVAFTQLTGSPDKVVTSETTPVAPVPESMLASVRNVVMPIAQNFDCLTSDDVLACFFDNSVVQKAAALQANEAAPYANEVIVPDASETSPEKPTGPAVGVMYEYVAPLTQETVRHD